MSRFPASPDFACYGSASTLHHIDGWYAGGNRQTIRLGHLADTERRRLTAYRLYSTSPIETVRSFPDRPSTPSRWLLLPVFSPQGLSICGRSPWSR